MLLTPYFADRGNRDEAGYRIRRAIFNSPVIVIALVMTILFAILAQYRFFESAPPGDQFFEQRSGVDGFMLEIESSEDIGLWSNTVWDITTPITALHRRFDWVTFEEKTYHSAYGATGAFYRPEVRL